MLPGVESAVALSSDFDPTDGPAVSVLVGGAHRANARLLPPSRPSGLVPRSRAVRRLLEAREVPVALLVAPAGYGKTTVLSEWDERDSRPFAWVGLDADTGQPARLLASIAAALEVSEPVGRGVLTAISSQRPDATRRALPRLLRYLTYREQPVVLVLDDAQHLHAPEALCILQALADGMPPGSQLALASRHEPRLAVGRLRAHRKVVELRAGDLAMSRAEAAALFEQAGLRLNADEIGTLLRRTEGWAAGLYLAALSLREERDVRAAVSRFGGADRLVAEYLRDEFLAPLGQEAQAFLTRTSVLDTLSGPLCDAVLERSGSGRILADLARSNALLIGLDRNGESYRHHALLAELLRSDLRRLEPRRESDLHRLASAWYAEHGDEDLAIRHAIAAGDVRVAGDLLWAGASEQIAYGRNESVQRRLEGFTPEQIAGCAPLAAVAAGSRLAAGAGGDAERWATAVGRRVNQASRDARRPLRAAALLPVAMAARAGLAHMARDASRARRLAPDEGILVSTCNFLEGAALHLTGERAKARGPLERGGRGGAAAAPNAQALCLAQLALLMIDENDWESAASATARARSQLDVAGLKSYPSMALVFAVSALVRAHRGMGEESRRDARDSLRLVARLTDFAPWYEAESRIVVARAQFRLGQVTEARTLLAEAGVFVRGTPDSPVLRDWADDAAQQLGAAKRSAEQAWTLTTAELRVLRLLPTHLSFPLIAKRLYVSPNTVKTHVRAVYRKLDASSRAEAVTLALDAGLLDVRRAT